MVQSFFFFHKFFQPSSKLCPSRGQKQVSRWRSFRKYLQGEKVCVVLWKSWSYVQTSHWRPAITSYGYIGKRKPKYCLCVYMKESFFFIQLKKVNRGSDTIFPKNIWRFFVVDRKQRSFVDFSVCGTAWKLLQTLQYAGHRGARLFSMQDIVELDYSACRTSRSSGQETADLEFLVPNK